MRVGIAFPEWLSFVQSRSVQRGKCARSFGIMDTDWVLEDWLLAAGERAERKVIAGAVLSPVEQLIRELWVFDMHTCNGGVSQYFCNHEPARWQALKTAWLPETVPSLGPILTEVDRLIAGASDAYLATLNASPVIDNFYYIHRLSAWREVRQIAADV